MVKVVLREVETESSQWEGSHCRGLLAVSVVANADGHSLSVFHCSEAETFESQPPDLSKEHWTQQSAHQTVQDSHQPPEAG